MDQNEKQNFDQHPFFDRVFVTRDEVVEKTSGGVFIPETERHKANKGVVIAAGPDCKFAFPGQRIVFGQHHGLDIMMGDKELTILREADIYSGEKKPTE